MKYILPLYVILILAACSNAQGYKIVGNVRDKDKCVNKHIKGAEVYIMPNGQNRIYSTLTDSLGNYSFDTSKVKANTTYKIYVNAMSTDYVYAYGQSQYDTVSTIGKIQGTICVKNFEMENHADRFPKVVFDFNSYSIDKTGNDIEFCELLKLLNDNPTISMEIDAHCSPNEGSNKAMESLSLERAKACRNYFVSQGVDSARLTAKGWGAKVTLLGCSASDIAKMKSAKDKEDAYAADRRAEFRVLDFNYKPKTGMSHLDSLKAKALNDAKVSGH